MCGLRENGSGNPFDIRIRDNLFAGIGEDADGDKWRPREYLELIRMSHYQIFRDFNLKTINKIILINYLFLIAIECHKTG